MSKHQSKPSKKDTCQVGLQLKSLQALFDPRTLHETCCVEMTPKTNSRSSKTPLRKRNLPPSFFKEPVNSQYDEGNHHFVADQTVSNQEIAFDVEEYIPETVPTLPTCAIESILNRTEFPDIVSEQFYRDSCDNLGCSTLYNNRTSECSSRPCESSLIGSYVYTRSDTSFETHNSNTSSFHPTNNCNNVELQTISNISFELDGNTQTRLDEIVNGVQWDGFLPLLNDPDETYMASPILNDSSNAECDVSDTLPTFPQTFYGEGEYHAYIDDFVKNRRDITDWTSSTYVQPCYTYL